MIRCRCCYHRVIGNIQHINVSASIDLGEEADVASGLAQAKAANPLETALQAREQVNNLMER